RKARAPADLSVSAKALLALLQGDHSRPERYRTGPRRSPTAGPRRRAGGIGGGEPAAHWPYLPSHPPLAGRSHRRRGDPPAGHGPLGARPASGGADGSRDDRGGPPSRPPAPAPG